MDTEPKPKKKGYDLIDLIALISGFEAVGLFIKTYKWAVQIPDLLHRASLAGKTFGMTVLTIGILLIYLALACLAVTLTIGLIAEKEWARKMAIGLYALAGFLFLLDLNIIAVLLNTAIVLYLCKKSVQEKFSPKAAGQSH